MCEVLSHAKSMVYGYHHEVLWVADVPRGFYDAFQMKSKVKRIKSKQTFIFYFYEN